MSLPLSTSLCSLNRWNNCGLKGNTGLFPRGGMSPVVLTNSTDDSGLEIIPDLPYNKEVTVDKDF